MRPLYELGDFVRKLRVRARFGRLSRAPLQLLEMRGNIAECEWLARAADDWDFDLPSDVRQRHADAQALEDAMEVRELLFVALPHLSCATFRVYRSSGAEREAPALIITGTVGRDEVVPATVNSLAMRAKLSGFRFWLDNGELRELQLE